MQKVEWGLEGVVLPIVTPFHEDFSVNWEGLADLVEYAITELKCEGICAVGTTGESPTLSHQEHGEVVKVVARQARGRVAVIAGAGSNATREAVELTRAAREAGVDATLQVCPYYNKPTQHGLYEHFKAVADAAHLPIIVYNIPGRTGRNIDPATIIRLWEDVPEVVALKDASGDLHQTMEVIRATDRATFKVYSGEDILTFAITCLGGSGAIAAVAHVVGKEVSAMVRAVWSGDLEEGRRINYHIMPVVEALFAEPNPIPVKQALEWLGLPAGPLRPPLGRMSPKAQAVLRTAMTEGGWLDA
jgi:4-hydroxy-tetrahydrodipicolinate synthase